MEEILNIIKKKEFKNENDCNSFLIHAGYSIDEIYIINNLKPSNKSIAFDKLSIIIKVLNEGWYPNWENESEYKWYNCFKMKGGFSYWTTYYYTTDTAVPSALCLKNKELALHMIKNYLSLYKDYYE